MQWFAMIAMVACFGCSDKSREGGLPPAKEWSGAGGSAAEGTPQNPHASAGTDPHAGMPTTGMTGMTGTNPHAGMGGTGADMGGMPAPDPNRPIDPAHHIKGVITVHPKAKDRAKPGTAIFVVVKRADASGAGAGMPLAVEKLTWAKPELAFEMTERQAMVAGTQLTGDVVVSARYDQDGDAISKQPGDITGQVRVTVPAEGVKLVLDQVLP